MNNFRRLAPAIFITAAYLLSPTAHAQTAEQRIEGLERKIRILEQKLELQAEEVTRQQVQLKKSGDVAKGAVIGKSNGSTLTFGSPDGDYSLRIGGRIQADAAFHNSDDLALGDGTEIRRAFLDIRGTVYKDWNYRFQYDFARPSGTDVSSRGIRDAWLQYSGFGPYIITIGSFKEPFNLERLASNLDTTFIERGLTDALFSPDRHIGVGVSTSQANWTAALGVFGETPEGDAAEEGDEGWDLTGRFTFAPVNASDRIIHLGVAGRYHVPEDSASSLRFRARPEAELTDIRLIDTGAIADVDDFQSLGLEAAGVYGPLSIQGEYIYTTVDRSGALPGLDFNSWYAYASYVLTGESRPYRGGIFSRVNPRKAVGQGGFGAWEIGLRYSTADLTDQAFIGGEEQNLTAGLNWYATSNIRFSANYIKVLDIDHPGNAVDGEDIDALTLRAQIEF